MFQQPAAGGDRVSIPELVGALCLIYVREVRDGIQTPYGEKEAVAVDLHVLDGPKAGESYENSMIFQGALIGALRAAAGGDPVLGRVGQGVAKPGQSAPYILNPFTEQDAALATAWISARPKAFQAPAPAEAVAGNSSAPLPPPAAPSPAPVPAVDYSALPAEVQELLRQSGAMS